MNILEIENLSLSLGSYLALADISFHIKKGEILGVVGESGSGKSLMNLALMNLLPENATLTYSKFHFTGIKMAMIFQGPMSALNPAFTVDEQLRDVILTHQKNANLSQKVDELLFKVGLSHNHYEIKKKYPFQLSGGMAQRVMIAMALAVGPDLLIADEPTTALDSTIQKQIVDLLVNLSATEQLSILFISHDISLVASFCHRIHVMYSKEIIETINIDEGKIKARHPYTLALMAARPSGDHKHKLTSIPGSIPNLKDIVSGCRFSSRCERAESSCYTHHPEIIFDQESQTYLRCPVVTSEKP